jgi:hypothetical protein
MRIQEKSEEMYKYFSEDMMNWKTFSIFVKIKNMKKYKGILLARMKKF